MLLLYWNSWAVGILYRRLQIVLWRGAFIFGVFYNFQSHYTKLAVFDVWEYWSSPTFVEFALIEACRLPISLIAPNGHIVEFWIGDLLASLSAPLGSTTCQLNPCILMRLGQFVMLASFSLSPPHHLIHQLAIHCSSMFAGQDCSERRHLLDSDLIISLDNPFSYAPRSLLKLIPFHMKLLWECLNRYQYIVSTYYQFLWS